MAVGADADRELAGAPVVRFGHLCGVYAELTAVPARQREGDRPDHLRTKVYGERVVSTPPR